MAELDTLEIRMVSNSDLAVQGLDRLVGALNRLKSAAQGGAGLSAVTRQLQNFATAVNSLDDANSQRLQSLANSLRGLSNIPRLSLSSTSRQLTNLAGGLRSLDGINVDRTRTQAISETLNTLANLPRISGTNINRQINALADGLQTLNSVSINQAVIEDIVRAMQSLSSIERVTGLTSAINALRRLPEISDQLRGMDLDRFEQQMERLAVAIRPLVNELARMGTVLTGLPPRILRLIERMMRLNDTGRNSLSVFSRLTSFGIGFLSFDLITDKMAEAVTSINKYIESTNLFAVSMEEFYEEASEYAELVSEKLGIDPALWMDAQGTFMLMAKGFGIAEEQAYALSKSLTELAYDISSLKNLDPEEAVVKLRSALAGELEPIRALGLSISEATLKEYALTKGITESVEAMTEQEKALLRSVKVLEDATRIGYVGDFVRTLESPANAIRVLQQQITQLGRAFGSVLLPIVVQVIPWVQAFVSVITDAIKALATFVGFTMPEWDVSDWENSLTTGADDATDALGAATKAAKELKNATIGIDELNIISEPAATGGAGVADELSDWANNLEIPEIWNEEMLEDIKSKAQALEEPLKKLLKLIGEIATGFLAWKIVSSFPDSLDGIRAKLRDIGKYAIGGIMITIGVSLLVDSISDILFGDGITLENIIKGGAGGILAGGGLGLMLATRLGLPWANTMITGAVIGFGISLALMGITGMIGDNSIDLEDVVLTTLGMLVTSTAITLARGGGLKAAALNAVIALGITVAISSIIAQLTGEVDLFGAIGTILGTAIAGAGLGAKLTKNAVGTGVGFALGVAVGILMEITGIKAAGEEAYEATEDFKIMQNILDDCTEASNHANEAMANLKSGLENLDNTAADFALAGTLADEIFDINEKAKPTAYELEQMAVKVDILNGLNIDGLRLSIDETTGRVIESREAVEELIAALEEEAKAEAMRDLLVQSYKDQFEAAQNAKRATQDWAAANEALTDTQKELEKTSIFDFKKYSQLKAAQEDQEEAVRAAEKAYADSMETFDELDGVIKDYSDALVDLKMEEAGVGDGVVTSMEDVRNELVAMSSEMPRYGRDIAAGLESGVDEGMEEANFKSILGRIGTWFKELFGIHSPSTVFAEYGVNIIEGLLQGIQETWGSITSFFSKKLPEWWKQISEWFTLKKWTELVSTINTSITTTWNDTVTQWGNSITDWWNTKVAPWFTLQKWTALVSTIASSIKNTWNDTVTEWSASISDWWSNNVEPWFTLEKWTTAVSGVKQAIGDAWADIAAGFETLKSTINTGWRPFWNGLGKVVAGVLNGIISAVEDGLNWVIKKLNSINFKLPNWLGGYEFGFNIKKVQLGRVTFVEQYADGGFPDMGQLFLARERGPELVGQIGTRTAVANNDQIVTGIQYGVEAANAAQNALLAEQNELLRAILAKEGQVILDGKTLKKAVDKAGRQAGASIMAGGVMD